MKKYVVWMYSSTSGGYDHQFYEIYSAPSKKEAASRAEKDLRYGDVHVVRVESYRPGR